MPLFPDTKITISRQDLPTLPAWQAEIARWDFLVPVALVEIDTSTASLCRADISGTAVSFTCRREQVGSVVAEHHPNLATAWSFAYSFKGNGEMLSSLAASIAALSYATATGGASYLPDTGALEELFILRQSIDGVLAVYCDRDDLYEERYGRDDEETQQGPMFISTRVD